jgi:hypothetical protein
MGRERQVEVGFLEPPLSPARASMLYGNRLKRRHMSEALIFAIWAASATVFQAALPFQGEYQVREFPNSEAGIDELTEWMAKSGHDKVDQICVSTPLDETTPIMKFFYEERAGVRVFLMNSLQVKLYAEKHGITAISAETAAKTCAQMFRGKSLEVKAART